ncbi:L-selenocysteinyl-tRNA(Sec) synthase [Nocardioides sp. Root122]|uniref:L-seryl-tRNA(Sec) selenium transferase n=1 Tax=Nocardioides TaxID=1839 RepID=UPI000702E70C|nr:MULTISPECIES: L-seryl-tRNA(Sec) selenium transferase [Nocardioides]KQV64250.1 L-selenocysteinyl-tRNA(Sec) synthase [Nocardioides sp. Root122]MCK9824799.1 L-seryl-tRNA(Sec) selenium transferase [Nocardioides cavernae]
MSDPRRAVPRTDHLLADPRLREAADRLGPALVKQAVVAAQQRCRDGAVAPEQVADLAVAALPASATTLRRVVNATGVVVHTNLGRAPLSAAAADALRTSAGATDVELDLATARRGRRGRGTLEALAAAVPDAEAVHVVNNGAAALALVTRVLCRDGGSVVIARGELVEIGDGFRIPELMESVGARLREVGTTNRVRLEDYAEAVDETTAFVLKVHPSNFAVRGFTSSVPVAGLAGLDAPLVVDIGSGLLAPHPRLPDEPDAASTLRAGADLVTASGDKLLGGPQSGLLLGRSALVERLRRDPFARALRVDKLTLAALEATLAGPVPPVAAALARSVADLRTRAAAIVAALPAGLEASVVDSDGAVGGGGAPEVVLPSAAVALPERLAEPLRALDLPVVGRLERGRLLLDLLAVDPSEDDAVADAVRRVAAATEEPG